VDALTARLTAASAREGLRKGFDRLLFRHSPIFEDVDGVEPGTVRCNWGLCGFVAVKEEPDEEDPYWWHVPFAEHQATVLAEALPL
jgi:hypothetical protein